MPFRSSQKVVEQIRGERNIAAPVVDGAPDLSVLHLHRRPPPSLPIDTFGPRWSRWIAENASASACPVDYVVAALLPAASATIGNARWPQATSIWTEPPHLWCAAVGDSGTGKSPGADAIYGRIVPVMEARMIGDFPDRLREHSARAAMVKLHIEAWRNGVRSALRKGIPSPMRPDLSDEDEPQQPRLVESDVTIEKVAVVLASAAPKGLVMVRDELAGWFLGMTTYNEGARPFWVEAYGGRQHRVNRIKHLRPIDVPRLVVAWYGGIQPANLDKVMRAPDDGLLSRFCWFWPDSVEFRLAAVAPDIEFAINAFDRLRMLDMKPPTEPGMPASPIYVPLTETGRGHLECFGREMQERQQAAGGLFASALGKARGLALRLSLLLEFLWWAAEDGMAAPPTQISEGAFLAAATLVSDYLMPMAERVYGDAAASARTRNTATLARWIAKTRPSEVYVRHLQREVRLPGLGEAAYIRAACDALVEAGWLLPPQPGDRDGRARVAYAVRPEVWEALDNADGAGPCLVALTV